MTKIQKILHGILFDMGSEGPAAVEIEIRTALLAMRADGDIGPETKEYFHNQIAMAVFGHRGEDPEDAQ